MSNLPDEGLLRAVMGRSGRPEGEEIRFQCPYPDQHQNGDAKPSARYHPAKHVWHCDACSAGGGWKDLSSLLGVALPANNKRQPQIVASYQYCNETGEVLRRKLRWQPGFSSRAKSFTWEKPDGQGRWTKCKGDGNPQVLYRSEDLPAARKASQLVLVVEGEKDVDKAVSLGFVAICNPEGAGKGKWKPQYSAQLQDLAIVVIADRDTVGRIHAASVAQSLESQAQSVRSLELPGEGVKDLSDWVAHREGQAVAMTSIASELAALLKSSPSSTPSRDANADSLTTAFQALEGLGECPDIAEIEAPVRAIAAAVAGLDALDRELARERAMQVLANKVKAPGRLVDAALKPTQAAASGALQGRSLSLQDPEPWSEPVDGSVLLDEIEATFLRFLVLPTGAAVALALWTLHTYAHNAAYISPLLALTSPEKRCGKTTLVSLLTALVRRSLPASNITAAALFRAVERYAPTLLIDEADTFLREREELRGILNSGHTQETAFVIRTVGDEHEPRCFSTWSPKVIALIGKLPSTLEDRSISVPMKRKAPGEAVTRLRLDRLKELADLRRRALRWAMDREVSLQSADPRVPEGLHDRAADNWRPLLAIADDAGGVWAEKARTAAQSLSNLDEGDSSARIQLLADVRAAFETREVDRLFTGDLLGYLTGAEALSWGEWRRGKPLTAIGLARLLKPFGVAPRKIRIGEETRQGYQVERFADAFARYLPNAGKPDRHSEHSEQPNSGVASGEVWPRNREPSVPGRKNAENSTTVGLVPDVPGSRGAEAEAGEPDREVFEL